MPNRLADATSPYLLQHRDNPVDWWPWGAEAFAEARRRDVPLLLSVGYAACHWCHVMAHESFEDSEVAAAMNASFVCVKVDREERPDVDAVYLEATSALTGHAGWPMTVFATPDGEPFVCGTYFPRPTFLALLDQVARAWRDQRAAVVDQGRRIVAALAERSVATGGPVEAGQLAEAVAVLAAEADRVHGGFGGAPKFPPSMCLEFLLRHAGRTGSAPAASLVALTADRMARGGLYDQLGGGFHRYCVDADWTVPHFEKMLYDNALLLRVYAHWWRQGGGALAERVVRETAAFLLDELRTAEGGFAASLDADSEGAEGRYYLWTPAELGPAAAGMFGVTDRPHVDGRSVLRLPTDPPAELLTAERTRLRAARDRRVRPARDDKVVTAWNGLAIAGLAEAGALFGERDWVGAAEAAARLLLEIHRDDDGRLRRTSLGGRPGAANGVLEDYADLAEGLLALYPATGRTGYLAAAAGLADRVLEHFANADGRLHDTADDGEPLVRRPRDPTDNATPSGSSAAAGALLGLAAYTGSTRYRDAAAAALAGCAPLLPRHARFAGWGAAVAEAALAGPVEVAVVGPAGPARDALTAVTRRSPSAGLVLAVGSGGAAEAVDDGGVPLLAGRVPVHGRPAAYVCRELRCEAPVTEPSELAAALGVGDTVSPG